MTSENWSESSKGTHLKEKNMKNTQGKKITTVKQFIAEFDGCPQFSLEGLIGLYKYYQNQESTFSEEEEINSQAISMEWNECSSAELIDDYQELNEFKEWLKENEDLRDEMPESEFIETQADAIADIIEENHIPVIKLGGSFIIYK